MDRGLIRQRWQITVPRSIRRALNLFIGQTLNFTLDEDYCIRISTGVLPSAEEAEFLDLLKGKKGRVPGRRKIRKSEGKREKQLRLQQERGSKVDKARRYEATGIDHLDFEEGKLELKELISGMSHFLQVLQGRL